VSHGGTAVGKEGELMLAFFIPRAVSHGGTIQGQGHTERESVS